MPFYALSVASVFAFRRRADYDPPFRVPLYPLVPALFILSTILLLGNAVVDPSSRWATLGVLGGIIAGIPVYYLTVGRRRNAGEPPNFFEAASLLCCDKIGLLAICSTGRFYPSKIPVGARVPAERTELNCTTLEGRRCSR